MFNGDRIIERAASGELTEFVQRSGHPSSPLAGEPYCTKSQEVSYHDSTGLKVAIAHRYLRADGTIGLSGKPDPKFVVHNGVRYHLDRQ